MTHPSIRFHPVAMASFLSCGTLALALAAPGAQAATITVNTTVDDNAMTCSLRDAVRSINTGGAVSGCVVNGTPGVDDTINLPAGTYRLAIGGLDETATGTGETATVTNVPDTSKGDLDLLKSVKIVGAGSGSTRIEWDSAETDSTKTDRIFHIYTTDAGTPNVNVSIQGVTLASGKTFQVDLGAHSDPVTNPSLHYYLRRAGGALALGGAANVVEIDTALSGAENANSGGLGGSTGGESGATTYSLTLNDVVINGNSAQGDGGGAYFAATTSGTNVVISNNRSTTNGGGLYNEANTSLSVTTFRANRAEGGGGIFATGSNSLSIGRTTFSANRAVGGGAISSRSDVTVNLSNATLSGNVGRDVGGGLYTNGAVNLKFVSIANNLAGADSSKAGSGINTFPSGSGVMTLQNVLLSNNRKGLTYDAMDPTTDALNDAFVWPTSAQVALLTPANCGTTSGGGGISVNSLGHNLSSDGSCANASNVLWLSDTTDKNSLDPLIGALADNGGGTDTHKLLAGSPALGAGMAVSGIATDQRGTTRDATPDIGAYEEPTPVAPAAGGGGGGCTAASGHLPLDPTLPLLAALGLAGWGMRRVRHARLAPINNKKP